MGFDIRSHTEVRNGNVPTAAFFFKHLGKRINAKNESDAINKLKASWRFNISIVHKKTHIEDKTLERLI